MNKQNDSQPSRENNHTLYIDLSSSWTNSSVQINTTDKGDAPVFKYPGLWAEDNDAIYLFSGQLSTFNKRKAPDIALWKFTATASGGTWERQEPSEPRAFNQFTRLSQALIAGSLDTGYALGGYTNEFTDFKLDRNLDIPVYGLISFNFADQSWNNVSATEYTTYGTAVSGQMMHVPIYEDNGLLLMFGRLRTTLKEYDQNSAQLEFSNVTIFDPATGRWHSQTTTGDTPPARELFCASRPKGQQQHI